MDCTGGKSDLFGFWADTSILRPWKIDGVAVTERNGYRAGDESDLQIYLQT